MELSGLHNAEMSNQNNNVRQDTEDEAEINKTVRESRFDEFDDVRVLNTFGICRFTFLVISSYEYCKIMCVFFNSI